MVFVSLLVNLVWIKSGLTVLKAQVLKWVSTWCNTDSEEGHLPFPWQGAGYKLQEAQSSRTHSQLLRWGRLLL